MCKVLGVSRSGYDAWRKRKPGKRWNENEVLLDRIQEIHQKNRRVYGSPRITEELHEQGTRCGKNRIARIMKDNGIRAEVKRRFKKTTDSKHNYSLAANLLIQDGYKGPLWASDITFVPTNEGWLYCPDQRGMALRISGHERAVQKDHRTIHERPADGGVGGYSA
jgi:transposase InsO family protein